MMDSQRQLKSLWAVTEGQGLTLQPCPNKASQPQRKNLTRMCGSLSESQASVHPAAEGALGADVDLWT